MSPQQVGRYQIRSQLGQGGMATVYLAYDPNFEREVAVKVLPPQFLHDPTFRKRFEQEARTIAKLEHHAIVPVYDFGEENGQPFIVMRLMKGGSLEERLAHGALTLTEAARILAWLAPGLDEAHRGGIIHRDLKPANMLFDLHDKPRIADFGIAKLTQATPSLKTGGIIGTPHYMSPEQWNGLALDGRSDVYAVGIILFEMLTSQCPYDASIPGSMMKMHLMDPVPNILHLRSDLPVGLQPIIEQAMAKDRTIRYSTVSALSHGYEFTAPVGSYPAGASLYNALDMAGNVWEWVADWYDERYYQNAPLRNPQGPDYGESRTQRSGSWDNGIALLNAANRVPALPSDRNYSRGFRCATSP